MNEQMLNNRVYLSGVIAEKPVFSHEVMGEGFYETVLRVKRLSDTSDLVPLTISERLLSANKAEVGDEIAIEGQFRSYNKNEDGKSRLILRVFVRDIVEVDPSKNPNTIELIGYVCKPPIYRTTPFKREICDLLIAVNRAYNKSDYIPCIAWGRNARYASSFNVGDRMIISGRIQSRDYNKLLSDGTYEKRTAYEVSVSQISVDEERADE
ncbi:MAG: single-stranded DNA-binding protein [Clostridiales bacterium]|nr:single-stranded DNA-binding protein [Clostridiales bacterium]